MDLGEEAVMLTVLVEQKAISLAATLLLLIGNGNNDGGAAREQKNDRPRFQYKRVLINFNISEKKSFSDHLNLQ